MVRFDKRGKLSPKDIGPFEVLTRVSIFSYWLALPLCLSDVHIVVHVSTLRKYTPNLTHVVDWGELVVEADATLEEGPVHIMDSRDQVF